MKRNIKPIKEIYAGGPHVDGNPTMRGGAYGYGNKNQMAAGLNPATQAIEDQEQDELNQNIEDQRKSLGKYAWLPGEPFQDIHADTDYKKDLTRAKNHDPVLERAEGMGAVGKLPGWPRENALEEPRLHLPLENLFIDNPLAGKSDGTEDYIIDDIIDELEGRVVESLLRELGSAGGANYPYSAKSYLPATKNKIEGQLGHQGMDPANSSPPGGYGAVLFPKNFIPKEWAQESDQEDIDMDGLPDDVDPDKKPPLEEKFTSKAQARYFYAQARKGGKKGKEWKSRAKEFSDSTPDFSKLPEKKKTKKEEVLYLKDVILEEIIGELKRIGRNG